MLACNIGKTDKIIRIIFGIVILALGYFFNTWLGLIGLLPILTAIIGRCGLYYPLKIDTTKKDK
ncbi:MAG TPA: YgaP-like transmembrane domain [Ignavibacteria bacterium]|nr:YgaP-like transmembrane domain [Ignavibacteria bacterium]